MANRKTTVEIPESKLYKQRKEKERVEIFQELEQSLRSATNKVKHYLSVEVDGLWPNHNSSDMGTRYCAKAQYGEWKIIVPAALLNFGDVVNGLEPYQLKGLYQSYINSLVGATIDVVIIAIDPVNKLCLANRKMAMNYLEEKNYFDTDKGGYSKMERAKRDNKNVECRVISVNQKWVFLDVFGHTVRMPIGEIGWRYVPDARLLIQTGDVVPVKIKELVIDRENKKIDMKVSMKDAVTNPNLVNCKSYPVDSTCTGTVVALYNGAYFVQTGDYTNGVDILCKYVTSPELPEVQDKVLVKIGFVNEEEGRIFGSIERIVKKRKRTIDL